MTFCLGILTAEGLLMATDPRSNTGVDHISTDNKLFEFSVPGEQVLILCTASTLSTTQSLMSAMQQDLKHQRDPNLHLLPTLYECARYIGETARTI